MPVPALMEVLALAWVKYSFVPSATLVVVRTTVPVKPFTLVTASVLSTFCQTVPLKIAQSPTFHEVMPSRLVLPATLTT